MKLNLGEFIRTKRLEKGLTMEQLANKIGKNKTFIFKLEKNQVKTLKHEMIEPLAKALDVPIIEMFNGFDVNAIKVQESDRYESFDDFIEGLSTFITSKYPGSNPDALIEAIKRMHDEGYEQEDVSLKEEKDNKEN